MSPADHVLSSMNGLYPHRASDLGWFMIKKQSDLGSTFHMDSSAYKQRHRQLQEDSHHPPPPHTQSCIRGQCLEVSRYSHVEDANLCSAWKGRFK